MNQVLLTMSLEAVYQRTLHHRTHRAGWLRAAVLGANDGLVSTASLMIGVSAAKAEGFPYHRLCCWHCGWSNVDGSGRICFGPISK